MNQKLKDDPFYFDALLCEDCGSTQEVYSHRFNDNVKCLRCVNDLMRAAEPKKNKYLLPVKGEDENE